MKKIFWGLVFTISVTSFVSADVSTGNKENKIIGGTKAPLGAWPATVALLDADTIESIESGSTRYSFDEANYQAQFCGATLIASKWVLTAAHCVTEKSTGRLLAASSIKALLGTSDLIYGGIRNNIKRIIVHPSYNYISGDRDLALLELQYDSSTRTIPVSANDVATGVLTTVVGWGARNVDGSNFPERLYEVDVPIVSRATCRDTYGSEFTQNMICAGYAAGGKDTCQSDSGGPLMVVENGHYVQTGVTSWGVGCAKPGFYGIYTRLSNFKPWINATINSNSGGGGLFFLLLPLSLLLMRRKIKGSVK